MFKVALREVPSPHLMERQPRYQILLNGKVWERHGPRSGDVYFNMTGYRGAIPTITGAVLDPGERGISVFRKEIARINKEAAELIEKQKNDQVKVFAVTDTVDPRYAKLRFSDGTDGVARKDHLANLTLPVTGMGESLARQICAPVLPKVYIYEAEEAVLAVAGAVAPRDGYQETLDAVRTKSDMNILLRLRSQAASLEERRPQGDDLGRRAGILRRWIDEEALPGHAAMRMAIIALQQGNAHADERTIGFDGPGFVEARHAEDVANQALAAFEAGSPDLMERVRGVVEAFQAISDEAPRNNGALEALALLVEERNPEDEPDGAEETGPGF